MRRLLLLVALVLVSATGLAASADSAGEAPRVEQFTPSGTAKQMRQVLARFSTPMVAFGDPRAPAPFEITAS